MQLLASQAPVRDILQVQTVDSEGHATFSGFDLKNKNAFGGSNLTKAEKERLQNADYTTGESAVELASKYNERNGADMVEVVMVNPSPKDNPSVPYMLLVHQVSAA